MIVRIIKAIGVLTFATLSVSSTSSAGTSFKINREMICDTAENITIAMSEWNEKSVWVGAVEGGITTTLTMNPVTETWTLLLSNGKHTCILDAGKGFSLAPAPEGDRNKSSGQKRLSM